MKSGRTGPVRLFFFIVDLLSLRGCKENKWSAAPRGIFFCKGRAAAAPLTVLFLLPQSCSVVAAICNSRINRSHQCFRCGQPGYQQRECSAESYSPICKAAQKPTYHKIESVVCEKAVGNKGGKRRRARPTTSASSNAPARHEEVRVLHATINHSSRALLIQSLAQ